MWSARVFERRGVRSTHQIHGDPSFCFTGEAPLTKDAQSSSDVSAKSNMTLLYSLKAERKKAYLPKIR